MHMIMHVMTSQLLYYVTMTFHSSNKITFILGTEYNKSNTNTASGKNRHVNRTQRQEKSYADMCPIYRVAQ